MSAALQLNHSMEHEDFEFFRQKIFNIAGISMSDVKFDLLQSRLRSRLVSLNFKSFSEYRAYLSELQDNDPEWECFINQLTTNKTDWFREPEHFKYMVQDFLPKWKLLGKKHLNVWCAASSTGEEPYTISLVLHEALKDTGITYSVFSTDIDTKVLETAKNGVYPKSRLDQIPLHFHSHFIPGSQEISHWMKVRNEIKGPVSYQQLNLTKNFKSEKKFDLILCRNVLIYFNPVTIGNVVKMMFENANNDCVLLIGHSESLQNITTTWKFARPSVYVKGGRF